MIRKRIVVHGRVQGVRFSLPCASGGPSPRDLGWVKNLPDGTVEIDAEGPSSRMKQFVEAVKKGSPVSKVTRMDIRDAAPTGCKQFEIRY